MREPTALLGLSVDGAPGVADAAQAVVDHLTADTCLAADVHLARAGRLRRVASSGQWLAPDGIPPGAGAVGRAYGTGNEAVGEETAASLPIVAAGQTVGVLAVGCREPPTADDLDDLRACAAALGRRIEAHPDPPDDGVRRLLCHMVEMTALDDAHAIAGALLGAALDLVALRSGALVRTAPGEAKPAAAVGPLADVLRTADLAPVLARVRDGSSCATTASEAPAPADLQALRAAGVESLVAVGLHARDELIAVLVLVSGDRLAIPTDDVDLLERLAAHAAACLQTCERLQALRDRAASDPLTGLGHHATFHEALAGCHRRPRTAVVVCDLDGFKLLNDTHGHAHGDRVLCGVADAMTGALRRGDRLFRVGGDEFAALLAVESDGEALDAAARLRDAVIAARLGVTVSIGVAVPRDQETDASLLARADRALYSAKAGGRDGVALARAA
jgi:diguanylate cyclase (GGDEF)-like protein